MDCGAEGEVVCGYRNRVTGQETLRDRCPTLRAFYEGWGTMLSDSLVAVLSVSIQQPDDRRREKIRHRPRAHGAEAQAGQVVAAGGGPRHPRAAHRARRREALWADTGRASAGRATRDP